MRKILFLLAIMLFCTFPAIAGEWEIRGGYFIPKVREMHPNAYIEGVYGWKNAEVGLGYTNIVMDSAAQTMVDDLDVIQARVGFKVPIKDFRIIGGVSHFYYRVDDYKPPQQTGGYLGVGYKKLGIRYWAADIDIDRPLIEHESNINGWLIEVRHEF